MSARSYFEQILGEWGLKDTAMPTLKLRCIFSDASPAYLTATAMAIIALLGFYIAHHRQGENLQEARMIMHCTGIALNGALLACCGLLARQW